jgi:general secretion pathway protein A
MYERYYGLREKPFSLTPDPDFLFLNEYFRAALDNVIYGIKRHEGFTVIVGDVGTGKTTLCWSLLGKLEKNIRTALILNPLLTEEDMLRAIIQDFGIPPRLNNFVPEVPDGNLPYDPTWMMGKTRKELIDELNYFLLEGAERDIFNILILDEAQNLSQQVLEQIRILSNLETPKRKLLQIIFVGQMEFEEKLRLPQLRQLNQRVTIRYTLKPLRKVEMIRYIQHRLNVAGAKESVGFTAGAYRALFNYSKGYPRLINMLCDRALLAGYGRRSRIITTKMVHKAARALKGTETDIRTRYFLMRRILVPALLLIGLVLTAAAAYLFFGGSWPVKGDSAQENAYLTAARPDRSQIAHAAPETQAGVSVNRNRSGKLAAAGSIVPVAAASDAGGESFLLQVHSLDTGRQAEAAIHELQGRGFPAFSKLVESPNGRQWHVVYAGPYDELSSAREAAAALRRQQGVLPILRRRPALPGVY